MQWSHEGEEGLPGLVPGHSLDSAVALTQATQLSAAQRNLLRYGFQGRLMLSFSTNHIQAN